MPVIDNREIQIGNFRFKLFHPSLAFRWYLERPKFLDLNLPIVENDCGYMIRVTREESLSRTIHAFLFGFSYDGVLKIRFVLSPIFADVLYQFSYNPGSIRPYQR